MPAKAHPDSSQPQIPSPLTPRRSRRTADTGEQQSEQPETGHLNGLAAMMNKSPSVQVQLKQAREIQNSSPVQRLHDLAVEINQGHSTESALPAQLKNDADTNRTGLPGGLKAGVENLSGLSLDDVKVHYNSPQPAQLNALAYAQGRDIHLAPGQEKHLPHEAWHIVQQKQGRVQPTVQMKESTPINDDPALEKEADAMGARALNTADEALQRKEADSSHQEHIAGSGLSSSPATVQRYKALAKEDYAVEHDEDEESDLFTTQSKEPTLKKNKKKSSIRHDIVRTNEKQDLNVAEDGTLAINNTEADAKEFYAADSVFGQSQEKLAAAHSLIKLVKTSGLRIAAGNVPLYKITPAPAGDEEQAQAGEFVSLVDHICIKFAERVMGNTHTYKHEAVFQEPGSEEERLANLRSNEFVGDSKVNRLAGLLGRPSKENFSQGYLRREMHNEDNEEVDPTLAGQEYGKKSGRGQLEAREKRMGINRHAHPEVGEGYATFSVSGNPDSPIDYATGGDPLERQGTWGYHFAGVVARSGDGQDTITLENYNRTDDLYKQLKNLLTRLINGNKAKIGVELAQVTPAEEEQASEIQNKLVKTLALVRGVTTKKAKEEFDRIARTYSAGQSWFFKMQGSRKGQSFHEQQVASGGFLNPLTLRVRPQNEHSNFLRAQYYMKLSYPSPPLSIRNENELNGSYEVKDSARKAMDEAETDELIVSAYQNGLFEVAKYLLEGTAAVARRLAQQQGINIPAGMAQPVISAATIQNKGQRARSLAQSCHDRINNRIGELWFWQKAAKATLRNLLPTIDEARDYVPLVANYHQQNRNFAPQEDEDGGE